ncbi:hypothetical protein AMATHDRAFT_54232 [Amanita thiersii Skay4041]|uniref:Uncharacterized protein n=1 Tax=Amanita thiersii Skay4041 TaxID=703135 RepID=A0A2A9NZY3_9AGAR|nr:hypothetical protein AMATHDRAFT_54232 [Amanita thiersii Skay4041]
MSQGSYFAQSHLLRVPHPTTRLISSSESFRRFINRSRGLNLSDHLDLYNYSISDYNFWQDLWSYLGVTYSVPPSQIIDKGPLLDEIPTWFPGARLNYAENILYHNSDSIAITSCDERGIVQDCSYRQLRAYVREMASAMRANGLQVGDRVTALITNSITAVTIALATTSIGAIYTSTAPDLGVQALLERYQQTRPKFIFAETEVLYAGVVTNLMPKVTTIVRVLAGKGLLKAILIPSAVNRKETRLEGSALSSTLTEFLASGNNDELVFAQLPFSHPAFILYTSGTSGRPKCIVHSAGGVLLQNMKCFKIEMGISTHDTFFQYTNTSWMVWIWMLTTLACGARLALYEGSPSYPDVRNFLNFVDSQGITVFGTGPRFLTEVQSQGIKPLELAPFESLRAVLVGGTVVTPTLHKWAQSAFGRHVHVFIATGCTDLMTTQTNASQTMPVYAGEMQVKSLGIKIEVFDSTGNNIEHTGQPGEMVCTRPHPSLPVFFWGDERGEKLKETYFGMYPGVYHQGDYLVVNPRTKGLIVLGRSDGVLNPKGIRFGSAEIYNVLEPFRSKIEDTLCVGQRRKNLDTDERVLLFVKMRKGQPFTQHLKEDIRRVIKEGLSKRHVPAWVGAIEDIPYTVNGKKIEIEVKRIVSGIDVRPSATMLNPESFRHFYKFREIEKFMAGSNEDLTVAKL